MKKKRTYFEPQTVWNELAAGELVCDSYDSGIDDFIHEDVEWKP